MVLSREENDIHKSYSIHNWSALKALVSQDPSKTTFMNDEELPSLPLPSLENTLNRLVQLEEQLIYLNCF